MVKELSRKENKGAEFAGRGMSVEQETANLIFFLSQQAFAVFAGSADIGPFRTQKTDKAVGVRDRARSLFGGNQQPIAFHQENTGGLIGAPAADHDMAAVGQTFMPGGVGYRQPDFKMAAVFKFKFR